VFRAVDIQEGTKAIDCPDSGCPDGVKCLIPAKDIHKQIDQLATEIVKKYPGKDPIYCIVVLVGAIVFFSDLARAISRKNKEIVFDVVKISSYDGTNSSDKIDLSLDLYQDITGRDVMIIEDIVDTGRSLSYLKKYVMDRKPRSVSICTLLNKPSRRVTEIQPEFVGFNIPDKFVVGFGMDFKQKYRELEFIGFVNG